MKSPWIPGAGYLSPTGTTTGSRFSIRTVFSWTNGNQFGRASGLFISADDNLYVSDNQSNTDRNPGWERGIRVGSASDGTVDAFIPDPAFDPTNTAATGAHGLAANASGEVFGAEVGATIVRKYERQ